MSPHITRTLVGSASNNGVVVTGKDIANAHATRPTNDVLRAQSDMSKQTSYGILKQPRLHYDMNRIESWPEFTPYFYPPAISPYRIRDT